MRTLSLLAVLTISGCASGAAVPVRKPLDDTIKVVTWAAPKSDLSNLANQCSGRFAVETIKHGYDSYIFMRAEPGGDVLLPGTGITRDGFRSLLGSGTLTDVFKRDANSSELFVFLIDGFNFS